MLARCLSVNNFGYISIVIAASGFLAPFSGVGTHMLLIKNYSLDERNSISMLKESLNKTLVSGLILSSILIFIFNEFYDNRFYFVSILLIISELVILRMLECFQFHFQAIGNFKKLAKYRAVIPIFRCLSIIILSVFIFYDENSDLLLVWSISYFILLTVCLFIYYLLYFDRKIKPSSEFKILEGLKYSSSLFVYSVFMTTDQLMIGKIIDVESVAIYAIASKIYLMLFLPFQAILVVYIRRFFSLGKESTRAVIELLRSTMIYAIPISLSISLVSILFLPLIPFLVGEEYSKSVEILEVMLFIFPIKVAYTLIADAITGIGLQAKRVKIETVSCIFNIISNIFLISKFGIMGAVYATAISELIMFILLFIVLCKVNKSDIK